MAHLNIHMDDEVKRQFELFCSSAGMSMTAAVNIFITTVINEQRIPFEISHDPFYDDDNMAKLKHSIENMRSGKGTYKTMEELEAMENA